MSELRGRALIENRFGVLGCGRQSLRIGGDVLSIDDLLFRMGLNFDDAKPIDVQTTPEGLHVVRYYDGQDQRIVAHEFNDRLEFVRETRAHIAEWIGDEAYFAFFSGH